MSSEEEKDKAKKELKEFIEKVLGERQFSGLLEATPEASELHEVINRLMSGDKDIDLKSEIHKPRELSVLNVIRDYAKEFNFKKAASILENFKISYLRNMVSANRMGRMEIVEILKHKFEELKEEIPVG